MRVRLLSLASVLYPFIPTSALKLGGSSQSGQIAFMEEDDARVDVTLYVMSRCSDARICESLFEDVIQAPGIENKINFNIQTIATVNDSAPLGIECTHGPMECVGNAHLLCLHHHLSLSSFNAALSCQNYQSSWPNEIGKVQPTRRCVEAAKEDWWDSGVGQCVQGHKARKDDGKKAEEQGKVGKEARRLLHENTEETLRRGVEQSCTIEIGSTMGKGGNRTCVVDSGAWKGCDDGHTAADFVRVIEEEWENLQSKRFE